MVKNPSTNAGDIRDVGLIPGSGKSLGEGNDYTLQYSCQENPMDRGTWWAMVHRVIKSQTWLKWLSMHTHTNIKGWWLLGVLIIEIMKGCSMFLPVYKYVNTMNWQDTPCTINCFCQELMDIAILCGCLAWTIYFFGFKSNSKRK